MSKTKIDNIINNNKNKLSIKEISDITSIPRNTVQRYLDKIGYDYIPHNKTPWNKGLTKDDNDIIKQSSIKRMGNTWNHTDEAKEKISQNRKGKHGIRDFSGTGNKYDYGGDPMNSDFMLKIAQQLDKEEIKWNMNNRMLSYNDKGVTRFISVDFYLDEYNIYISVRYHIHGDTRNKLLRAARENGVKVLIIDEMLYRRIKYTSIKEVLKNSLQN